VVKPKIRRSNITAYNADILYINVVYFSDTANYFAGFTNTNNG